MQPPEEDTLTRRTIAKPPRRRSERGLTLVELLVVLLIIGLIAAFAVPQVMNYLGGARRDSAEVQVNQLSGILDLYRLDTGRYPEDLEALVEQPSDADGWNGPYVRKADALIDPWGEAYVYRMPGEHGRFDLMSLGADGREGGEGEDADIVNW